MRTHGIATRKAVAAGLGLAMALGTVAPVVALAESTGQTNFYVTASGDDITTHEGAEDENIKVVLPVAINYVADAEGRLTGPSDDTVKIKNNTVLGSVRVSKIQAMPAYGMTIVESRAEADSDGDVYLTMRPGNGQEVSLASHLEESEPANPGQWSIAQKGELALNGLTGKIGGFGNVDPSTKTQLASVFWTVAPGTASQVATNAQRITIHYVYPDGYIYDSTTGRTSNDSLASGYTWKTAEGTVVTTIASAAQAASGASEITLYGTKN